MSNGHGLFAYLNKCVGIVLNRAEHGRRDAYLASCADIGELERRMRAIESDA
ncbi:DUF3563 family protein [Paraburkholderia dilworthii]|uniref:DUF3563 family protein n=1 Tax=Paraburkholderia dilworthii TaxID=948106 RepID=UPI001269656E|nr:DUF3563 family protein [Paraburkholderia dilworthii]